MKSITQRLRRGACATSSFLGALLRPEDRVEATTPEGYPILEGWPRPAEQAIAAAVRNAPAAPAPRYALYCFEGAHRGEAILLHRDVETVGTEARHTIVLTPVGDTPSGTFQFFLSDGLRCLAAAGDSFRVNGRELRDASLFDFDRLDLSGNRFVVLDLAWAQAAAPEVRR
jgi:hypothetical protein